jgi:hypothetical protein
MRVKVRASSWSGLFDCAHKWEGVNLMGMKSVSGLRATLGTAIHASTAVFDESRMLGTGVTAMEAAGAFIDTLHNPQGEVDYRNEDLTLTEAERIGLVLHSKYCTEVSPRYEFSSVELTAKPLVIGMGDGLEIEITGTLDRSRIIKSSFGTCIGDLKTGRMAVSTNSNGQRVATTVGHAAQVGTYEILYEHSTGEEITAPSEIIGLSTGSKQDIATGQIPNARDVLLGKDDKPGLIEYAAVMFKSGLFPPNPKSQLCSGKYCPRYSRCSFKNK